MIKEFKEFMMRGNVIDMAVGVVIGGAFTAIVTNIVNGLINPLIAYIIYLITGSKDTKFTGLDITVAKGVTFQFGLVISAIITFIITGLVLFIIVKAVNKTKTIGQKEQEEEAATEVTELDYLEEIRDLLAGKKDNDK
ncbi:MAG: large conductance mechanosensitive channel protein MscL [Lactobacillales bacterium]|jgi:large conductance mechanosensitive channel|nr:large conductance mechanosensitive channel protein MscL [Lactobacillales bacterium]